MVDWQVRRNQLDVYDTSNSGLPSNNVSSIAFGGSGNKWIVTDWVCGAQKSIVIDPSCIECLYGSDLHGLTVAIVGVYHDTPISSIAIDDAMTISGLEHILLEHMVVDC